MKRISNLFDEIISLENLEIASRKAKKNKNKIGQVKRFEKDSDNFLLKLHANLKHKNFTTSKYRIFKVNDKD